MKGSDSALPVWADFMQQALNMHPEWNGDWAMPGGIKKAEIDIRNGTLIRELDASDSALTGKTPTPTPSPKKPSPEAVTNVYDEPLPEPPKEVFVTDVPAEFRRVELFLLGTLPNRNMVPTIDESLNPNSEPLPTPVPTPLSGTWQDGAEPPGAPAEKKDGKSGSQGRSRGTLTVMICPLTGMRATINCPTKEARSFSEDTQPKEFCTFHR
jgi:hypothetical protein